MSRLTSRNPKGVGPVTIDYQAELRNLVDSKPLLRLTPNGEEFGVDGNLANFTIEIRGAELSDFKGLLKETFRETLNAIESSELRSQLKVTVSIPAFGIKDLSIEDLGSLPNQSFDRDDATQMRGPLEFYDEAKLAIINNTLGGGPGLLVRTDFQNVGIANDCGLGEVVNELMALAPTLAFEAGLRGSGSRRGGDESTTITAIEGANTITQLKNADEAFNQRREELFEKHSEKVELAIAMVARRLALQELTALTRIHLRELCDTLKPQAIRSKSRVDKFIEARLRRQFSTELAAHEDEHDVTNLLSILADKSADRFKDAARKQLLAKNTVYVKFQGELTPAQVLAMEAVADQEIARRKQVGYDGATADPIVFDSSNIQLGEQLLEEIQSTRKRSRQIALLEEQLHLKDHALEAKDKSDILNTILRRVLAEYQLRDPTTLALRGNMVKDFTARQILGINESKEKYIFQIDLPGAGILNNNLGREVLDKFMNEAVNVFQHLTGCSRGLRSSGGLVTFVMDKPIDQMTLLKLRKALNKKLKELVPFGEPDLDNYIKAALKGKKPAALGTITLAQRKQLVNPDDKMSPIIEKPKDAGAGPS